MEGWTWDAAGSEPVRDGDIVALWDSAYRTGDRVTAKGTEAEPSLRGSRRGASSTDRIGQFLDLFVEAIV